jgi:hypothetical protein
MGVIAPTSADVRDVLVDDRAGLRATAPAGWCPTFTETKRRVLWPDGAQALTFSAEEPESPCKGTPAHWSEEAIRLHDELDAQDLVVQTNSGGDMVIDMIEQAAVRMHEREKRPDPFMSATRSDGRSSSTTYTRVSSASLSRARRPARRTARCDRIEKSVAASMFMDSAPVSSDAPSFRACSMQGPCRGRWLARSGTAPVRPPSPPPAERVRPILPSIKTIQKPNPVSRQRQGR